MRHMLVALPAIAISLASSSCRVAHDSSLVRDADVTAGQRVLVVTSGGFNSCGWVSDTAGLSAENPQAGRFWGNPGETSVANFGYATGQKLASEKNVTVHYMYTCYNAMNSNYIYYYANTKNGQRTLRYVGWREFQDLVQTVTRMAAGYDRVFFIGHSYGGWLNLWFASSFNNPTKATLVTIDPISPFHCNQGQFITGGDGCKSFPPGWLDDDGSHSQVRDLRAKVRKWYHIYQDVYKSLHSTGVRFDACNESDNTPSVMPNGRSDSPRSYSTDSQTGIADTGGWCRQKGFTSSNAHSEIDDDSLTWRLIARYAFGLGDFSPVGLTDDLTEVDGSERPAARESAPDADRQESMAGLPELVPVSPSDVVEADQSVRQRLESDFAAAKELETLVGKLENTATSDADKAAAKRRILELLPPSGAAEPAHP